MSTNNTGSSVALATASTPPVRTPWSDFLRRFRRNYLAGIAFVVIVVMCLGVVFAPHLTPHNPAEQNIRRVLDTPSRDHLLGTDQFGRDVLTRILYGGRVSLAISFSAVTIIVLLGTSVGAVAGFYGGKADMLLMRFVDVMMTLPVFFLLLTMVAVFGASTQTTIIVIGLTSWMSTARLIRGQILSIRTTEFVQAARSLGASDGRIILKHILPNTMAVLIVQATLHISTAVLLEASLSYLGLGAQPPQPSWGNMLAASREYMRDAWWLTVFPGMAIFLTVLSFNLLGDGLRDALDPKLRN